MMPTEVLDILCDRLGTREFKYFVNPRSEGTLRILLYVEDFTVLHSQQFDCLRRGDDANFAHYRCRAWRLPCCREALVADWNCWHSWLNEPGCYQNCGNVINGVGSLVDYLRDQVKEKVLLYGKS